MLFTEFPFLLFFALAFGVHWLLRASGARKTWLLLCSYAFYAAWDWRFLGLIVASTLIDFFSGRALGREGPGRRRPWLVLSLAGNLGMLGVFKYYDFFADSASALLASAGLETSVERLSLVLPVGISFYTFQTLSYTIDVYRRRLQPIDGLRDFALFVAFFPQLVAGPIVRASSFLPQLAEPRRFAAVAWRPALTLFLFGYIKKACVADNVAVVVDQVFSAPDAYGPSAKWLALLLYSVQIYCDFSGYSDMAIATAAAFGYALPENFAFPYLARSITEFWRRWHISLSTWFRDYLYIPLGGNQHGPARTYRNLCIVFLLCGLWHGASWSFIAWGLFHGAFLVLERVVGWKGEHPLARLYALPVAVLAWVLFRAPDLSSAVAYYGSLFGGGGAGTESVAGFWWGVLGAFAVVHVVMSTRIVDRALTALPQFVFAILYGAAWALVFPWVAVSYTPFIYFQF